MTLLRVLLISLLVMAATTASAATPYIQGHVTQLTTFGTDKQFAMVMDASAVNMGTITSCEAGRLLVFNSFSSVDQAKEAFALALAAFLSGKIVYVESMGFSPIDGYCYLAPKILVKNS